jgi:hypothetical protein
MFIIAIIIPTITSCYLTIRVHWNFKRTVNRSRRHSFAGSTSSPATEKRIQVVQWQTIRYTVAYLNTIVWSLATFIVAVFVDDTDIDNWYWIRVCTALFFPLQGFFFFFIFCLPSAHAWKAAEPDSSMMRIFKKIMIDNESVPPISSNQHRNAASNQSASTSRDDHAAKLPPEIGGTTTSQVDQTTRSFNDDSVKNEEAT